MQDTMARTTGQSQESGEAPTKEEEEILPKASFNGSLTRFSYSHSLKPDGLPDNSQSTTTDRHNPLKRKAQPTANLLPPSPRRQRHLPSPSPTRGHPRRPPLTASRSCSSSSKTAHTSPSKYAHLPNHLTDTIPPNLTLLFIGVNPGLTTASTGHVYAHPSNLYWKLLHSSGITPILHKPSDTYLLPSLYNMGNTNIVERPTRDASELTKQEMEAGVPILEAKIQAQKPRAVCIVGKGIWEAIWKVKTGRKLSKGDFRYGWQDRHMNMGVVEGEGGKQEGGCAESKENDDSNGAMWNGAKVFVATTTSGLAAGMKPKEKEDIWRELGVWVEEMRREAARL